MILLVEDNLSLNLDRYYISHQEPIIADTIGRLGDLILYIIIGKHVFP